MRRNRIVVPAANQARLGIESRSAPKLNRLPVVGKRGAGCRMRQLRVDPHNVADLRQCFQISRHAPDRSRPSTCRRCRDADESSRIFRKAALPRRSSASANLVRLPGFLLACVCRWLDLRVGCSSAGLCAVQPLAKAEQTPAVSLEERIIRRSWQGRLLYGPYSAANRALNRLRFARKPPVSVDAAPPHAQSAAVATLRSFWP